MSLSQLRLYRDDSPASPPCSLPDELSNTGLSSDDGWSDVGVSMGKTESVLDTGYHNEHAEAGASKEGDIGGTSPYYREDTPQVNLSIQDQLSSLSLSVQSNQDILLNQLQAQYQQIILLQTSLHTLQTQLDDNTRLREQKKEQKEKHKQKVKEPRTHPLRPLPGISPEKVIDLATNLASGLTDATQAVEIMFKWLENVNPIAATVLGEGRDELEPMIRVGNLEGVLDVTLGRVGRLEVEIEGMKREWRDGLRPGPVIEGEGGGGSGRKRGRSGSFESQDSVVFA